ncbi:CHAT domain-containing protein [Xylariaceae sp. FL1651]|nr:CHAT domain-containing protein [Xylariaceae sp. FL1651]
MGADSVTIDPSSGSWTAYPSLLPSLTNEQQVLLENAASAHYCGRYQEADAIFTSELPPSHTIPIVALQHADMLTASGRERDRVNVIRAALSSPDLEEGASRPLKLLLRLMLAEAEFFGFGWLPDVCELLPHVRSLFWDGGVDALSDFQFTDVLRVDTNLLKEVDKKVFEDDVADTQFASRFDELLAIYRALKTEMRWRHAPSLMMLLLKYAPPGEKRQDAIKEATELRETLTAADHPGIKFRSVPLRTSLAALLNEQLASILRESIRVLAQLAAPRFASWQDFCPVVASTSAKLECIQAAAQPRDLITSLGRLAKAAERRNDFLIANQLHMAARDTHYQWINMISDNDASRPVVLDSFRQLQEKYVVFQEKIMRSDYYYAVAMEDFLSTLNTRFRNYDAVITMVDSFETSHPHFDNPRILERIYDLAGYAALERGQDEKLAHYREQQQRWEALCPISDSSGNLADKTVLDPSYVIQWIQGGRDMVRWGDNAVRVMLRWAAYEWDEGLLSTEEANALFRPGLVDMPCEEVSTYLRKVKFTDVATKLLGTTVDPVNSAQFFKSYQRLLKWAQTPGRRPSLGARLFTINIFIKSRIRRLGDYLMTIHDRVSSEDQTTYEAERAMQLEVEQLQAQADNKFIDSTRVKRDAIHTLLVKCYQASQRAEAGKAIPEADFIARIDDAQSLATVFENRGDLLRQYDAITALIRLLWQYYLIHRRVPPEAVLEPAERAEAVFSKVRDLIVSKVPPDNLVARAKVPTNFSYQEHYRFALLGSLFAHKRHEEHLDSVVVKKAERKVGHFLAEFLSWALRSKGRGFADILSMEVDVTKSIDAVTPLPSDTQTDIQTELSGEDTGLSPGPNTTVAEATANLENLTFVSKIDPFRGATVTAAQIAEMMSALPEGVVIADYIDLPYSPVDVKRLVILYRREQCPLLVPVTDGPDKSSRWVKQNLAHIERPLDGPSSTEQLAALSGLVGFVEKEEFFVKEGETLVLCPTGILHRIPLHAIPINGRPLIERNPVVYCQSLTILYWLWKKSLGKRGLPAETAPKVTVINPMPDNWPSKDGQTGSDPVMSTPGIQKLASQLGASYHGGYPVDREAALHAIAGSHTLHYHGHVQYNPRSAIDSVMCLSMASFKAPFSKRTRSESISARALFGVRLATPALATIVGCGSGVVDVSSVDDVLGLPTALFFAGAGAVVSTLWSIDDEDGETFATEFYPALERRRAAAPAAGAARDGSLGGMVDLAAAMRESILALRCREGDELKAPYHWAAFTLNGFHMLPRGVLPATRETLRR